MILVFHWQLNALMFLALQHCTYAAIHDLVARAMFLEARGCGFLLLFISEISPSDTRGKLSMVYCHCSCILLNKMRIFEGGNTSVLCSGISVRWMFTSVCRGCCEVIHSRPQRPRSFWSAPRIATSGQVQHRKSAIHGLPVTPRMFRVKFDKSDWFWSQSIVFTKPFKNGVPLDQARSRDSWC